MHMMAMLTSLCTCWPWPGVCRGEKALKTNFVSDKPSSWYSQMYQRDNLPGGHVIMLGADDASK